MKSIKLLNSLFILLMLVTALTSASPVQAGEPQSPLTASGDFIWAKSTGGTVTDLVFSMTIDPSGNIYITGLFNGTADFDPGIGTTNLTSNGFSDVFVAKYSNNGQFAWAKQIGSSDGDWGRDITLDTNGNVYITGTFGGVVDFDPGAGEYNITSAGQLDMFILKLDQDGNFLWAKNMGGTNLDEGYKIKTDNEGNIFLLAQFYETADHDPNLSTFNLTSVGMGDLSITKLDSSGNFVWAKGFGGTSDDYANSFIIGPTGNLYITGNFENTVDFDPNAGVANRTSNGFYDMFVSALDKDGQFLWAINIGGSDIDDGMDIELGSNEDVYVSGAFIGTVDFDPGAGTASRTSAGLDDIYILKLDKNGNYGWVSAIGSSGVDYANDIEIGSNQNIYISGAYSNTIDFDPFAGTTNLTSAGGTDIFLSKFNNSGQLLWAKSMGGTLNDSPNGFEIDASNNLLTTGSFRGTADFDPGAGTLDLTSAGGSDIFLAKLEGDQVGGPLPTSATFDDVPMNHPYWADIEILYANGYTAGCSTSAPLLFCPETTMNRAQSAVFMVRGNFGTSYSPPAAPWTTFGDDFSPGPWAQPWAQGMFDAGLTAGCSTNPRLFCPWEEMPRFQAAVFGMRLREGINYPPPAGTGTVFADIDGSEWYAGWVEQAYLNGLLPACGSSGGSPLFCPNDLVPRGLAAYMIVRAKNLSMP